MEKDLLVIAECGLSIVHRSPHNTANVITIMLLQASSVFGDSESGSGWSASGSGNLGIRQGICSIWLCGHTLVEIMSIIWSKLVMILVTCSSHCRHDFH